MMGTSGHAWRGGETLGRWTYWGKVIIKNRDCINGIWMRFIYNPYALWMRIWMRFIYNPYMLHGAGIFMNTNLHDWAIALHCHFGGKCRDSYSSTMVRIWE
jgi:hypothetical protein